MKKTIIGLLAVLCCVTVLATGAGIAPAVIDFDKVHRGSSSTIIVETQAINALYCDLKTRQYKDLFDFPEMINYTNITPSGTNNVRKKQINFTITIPKNFDKGQYETKLLLLCYNNPDDIFEIKTGVQAQVDWEVIKKDKKVKKIKNSS